MLEYFYLAQLKYIMKFPFFVSSASKHLVTAIYFNVTFV